MRVCSPSPSNCLEKSIKNKINLMYYNKENNELQQQQKHDQHHHDYDVHELWSLPIIKCSYFFAFIFVTLFMQHYVIVANANDSRISGTLDGVTKGLKSRMRSPKIASIHFLQAVPESLPANQKPANVALGVTGAVAAAVDNQTNVPPAGKFGKL